MKHDMLIALIFLQTGWTLRSHIADKFCLRCKSRHFFLAMTRYGINQNSFITRFVFISGAQLYVISSFLEIAQAWGFKRTVLVVKSIMEALLNARKAKR